jgi:hypothetical protein
MGDVVLFYDREIDLGIPLSGYRLIPGAPDSAGLPLEAFLQLYAVNNQGNQVLIATPADLSPFVTRIPDEAAAWRLLHLFTSPETHYLFQKDEYTLDLQVTTNGSVGPGSISSELARSIGYTPAQIVHEGANYRATRDLVRASAVASPAPATIVRRRESLGEDGTYRLLEERAIAQVERYAVHVPSYE